MDQHIGSSQGQHFNQMPQKRQYQQEQQQSFEDANSLIVDYQNLLDLHFTGCGSYSQLPGDPQYASLPAEHNHPVLQDSSGVYYESDQLVFRAKQSPNQHPHYPHHSHHFNPTGTEQLQHPSSFAICNLGYPTMHQNIDVTRQSSLSIGSQNCEDNDKSAKENSSLAPKISKKDKESKESRVSSEKSRAAKACVRCRNKKAKCTPQDDLDPNLPCKACQESEVDCEEYDLNTGVTRVRGHLKRIETELDAERAHNQALTEQVRSLATMVERMTRGNESLRQELEESRRLLATHGLIPNISMVQTVQGMPTPAVSPQIQASQNVPTQSSGGN